MSSAEEELSFNNLFIVNEPIDDAPLVGGDVPFSREEGLRLSKLNPPVKTKQHLLGEFMKLSCNKKLFAQLLISARLERSRANMCAEAFAMKAAEFCQPPGAAAPPPVTAKGAFDSMTQANFLNNLVRTDPLADGMVPGIAGKGKDTGGITKLENGPLKIKTACQLMGYFIALGRDQNKFWGLVLQPVGIRWQDLNNSRALTLSCFE